MAERLLYGEWRAQNAATQYPFTERATLRNQDGDQLLDGMLLDAAIYAPGLQERAYLSRVTIEHDRVTLTIGDAAAVERASGSSPLIRPAAAVALADSYGRPAGLLVSDGVRLGAFQSWSLGVHEFQRTQTPFCPTVCFPAPEGSVEGFLLDDGSFVSGDVWLVGEDGVVITRGMGLIRETACQEDRTVDVVRIDAVGDPLYRRRLCAPHELFETPRFLRKVRFQDAFRAFECEPDEIGAIRLAVDAGLAGDTVLRITATPEGLLIGVAGDTLFPDG